MSRYLWILALIVLLALAAVACEEDEEEGTPTATATPTPTVAATGTPAEGVAYPVTVTDMMDRSVTIEAAPQRIAATSPTTLETLYAVGGTAVARESTSDCDAIDVVRVGGPIALLLAVPVHEVERQHSILAGVANCPGCQYSADVP